MSIAAVMVNIMGDGTTRIVLFIMILIAVALILTGCIIALLTLYNQRKMRNTGKT